MKHDDSMDVFAFMRGNIIGQVSKVTVDDNGVVANVTLRKPNREEINMKQKFNSIDGVMEMNNLIKVDPTKAIKEWDVHGNLTGLYFEADDEALMPILVHSTLKVRPSQRYATISKSMKEVADYTAKQKNRSRRISEMLDVIDTPPQQIKIDVSELEEIQCKACKAKFQPNTEFHYVAKSKTPTILFSTSDESLHDAYDCPLCGSQIILGERLERLK